MKKSFLKFKMYDYYFQLGMLITGVIVAIFLALFLEPIYAMWFYAIVGTSQLISFLINWYKAGNKQSTNRLYFSYMLLVFIIACVPPITFVGLMLLLFLSPITAIAYVYLTYLELQVLKFFS